MRLQNLKVAEDSICEENCQHEAEGSMFRSSEVVLASTNTLFKNPACFNDGGFAMNAITKTGLEIGECSTGG